MTWTNECGRERGFNGGTNTRSGVNHRHCRCLRHRLDLPWRPDLHQRRRSRRFGPYSRRACTSETRPEICEAECGGFAQFEVGKVIERESVELGVRTRMNGSDVSSGLGALRMGLLFMNQQFYFFMFYHLWRLIAATTSSSLKNTSCNFLMIYNRQKNKYYYK